MNAQQRRNERRKAKAAEFKLKIRAEANNTVDTGEKQ